MKNLLANKKKQLWVWFPISLALVLILVVIIYLVVSNLLKYESKESVGNQPDTIKQEQSKLLTTFDINKSFSGTRESIDGSIEAVLFEINSIDTISKSFEFTLNIGMAKKVKGYGSLNLNHRKISADVLGELIIIIDNNGKIKLKTSGKSNQKFNLMEESK
ncbi:MAG TPA: hypothetical protein PLE30_01900 [Candidatus Kapabacteria bacterium]|nr:hypothetical protein [Candidatus Kapabacteria bacterium]